MTPTEAAMILREAMKDEADLAYAVTQIIDRSKCADLYQWVEEYPDHAMALAQAEIDTKEQLAEYARALEKGALGARQDDQPSA